MELIHQILEFIVSHRKEIEDFFLFPSFLAIIIAILLLFEDLKRRLMGKDFLFLGVGVFSSLLLRIRYGLFGPWHPEDHYVEILMNLVRNKEAGSLLSAPYVYGGKLSGGIFELFYNNILIFFQEFHVYQVYYISIFLHILCGVFIFLLALNLFQKKAIAFISLFIFAFLPLLIKISATEVKIIMEAFPLLLFINFIFYIKKYQKENSVLYYLILFFLFFANLAGRRDFMPFFIASFFSLSFLFLFFHQSYFQKFIKNKYIVIFFIVTLFSSVFYFLAYFYVDGVDFIKQDNYLWGRSIAEDFYFLKNLLYFHDGEKTTLAFHLKSFFTPWYFFIGLLISPIILLIKKRYMLFFGFLLCFAFAFFLQDMELSNSARKHFPLLFLAIPCISFSFYTILRWLRIPNLATTIVIILIVIGSFFQNWEFLSMNSAAKEEQDFLDFHIKNTIPPKSLLLTIHEKKYEPSKFPQRDVYYRFYVHGNEFYSFLLPGTGIDVMDIYREYDPEIINKYDHVFYYRPLYAHHEADQEIIQELFGSHRMPENPHHKNAHEVAKIFEKTHHLISIEKREISNFDFANRTVSGIREKRGFSILAQGDLEVGLFKVENINSTKNDYVELIYDN